MSKWSAETPPLLRSFLKTNTEILILHSVRGIGFRSSGCVCVFMSEHVLKCVSICSVLCVLQMNIVASAVCCSGITSTRPLGVSVWKLETYEGTEPGRARVCVCVSAYV